MIYEGVFDNRGIVLFGDEQAAEYAIGQMGLAIEDEKWLEDGRDMFLAYFSLDDFFSGNWITYDTIDEYEEENSVKSSYADDYSDSHAYWEAERRRTESRL